MTQSEANYDLNDNGLLDLDVYFDFTCPFSYQTALWVKDVSELMGSDVMAVRWKFFSNAQANKDDSAGNIWDSSDSAGNAAFAAGSAAYQVGGEDALLKFYLALGRLYHEEGQSTSEKGPIEQAWQEAGLDSGLLAVALDGSNMAGLQKLEQDHTEAVEKYGAFGSPTLVFEEHRAFFLKLKSRPADISDALELFQHVQRLAMGFPDVEEYKKIGKEE